MTSFQDVWNATYESVPGDTDQESLGAGDIRDLKVNIRERLAVDHSMNGDANDGMHEALSLIAQASDPAPTFLAGTSGASLYTKVVNSVVELFFKNSAGMTQITSAGTILGNPPGTYIFIAAGAIPSGYLECNGQLVSRTTYAALFAQIGTTFGAGDGSTTFALPNVNGKVLAGRNGSFTTTGAGAFNNNNAGSSGGEYAHQQLVSEIAAHNHPATDSGHAHPFTAVLGNSNIQQGGGAGTPGGTPPAQSTTGVGNANISVGNTGSNTPMNIVQPTMIGICCIKT